jgi:hypothetical protein
VLQEHDVVVLTCALPDHRLEAGDVGAIVAIHDGGKGFTVEFVTFAGETVAIATVDAAAVRPIREREIANVRLVA